MKHSSVLMLGLATLALSNASAYASESLNFNPSPSEQSASYMAAVSSQVATEKRSTSNIESSKTSAALPNIPLFELPPFQSKPSELPPLDPPFSKGSDDSSHDQTRSDSPSPTLSYGRNKFQHSDRYSDSKPFTSKSPTQSSPSPFVLPDELTDSDLFESDSAQMNEPNSSNADSPRSNSPRSDSFRSDSISNSSLDSSPDSLSHNNLEPGFEVTPDAGTESLNGWFKSNHSGDSENKGTSELNRRNTPSLSIAKSNEPDSLTGSLTKDETIGLDFDPPGQSYTSSLIPESVDSPEPIASLPTSLPKVISGESSSLDQLFQGNSDSLVAVAVGSAEGTRSADGGKNPAYQGHTDPGNGVWNLGSFSYQHGASSPEEADAKQLARLRSQAQTILDMAAAKGLDLTLEEKLNGIDLANQAPKAALDEYGGYIDWLVTARTSGLDGSDAILSARVRSFLDPQTKTWDAPGLGNSEERITLDQERRMLAIAKAIATYMQDVADHQPTDQSPDQSTHQFTNQSISRRVPAKTQATVQLFTQKVMQLFGNSADVRKAQASEPELPIVEQILALDLSNLRAA